ncbi:MAG: hypothetical protein ACRDPP_00030 [Gaiellaceae bacterium]
MGSLAKVAKEGPFVLPGVRFEETGLVLTDGLSFESWRRLLAFVEHLHDRAPWWIGDLLVHGEREFGELYAAAVGGRSPEAMKTYAWVAERVAPRRRRASLSWSAHREVAALEPDRQEELLARAERERLGSRDVRALIRADRAESDPDELVTVNVRVTRGTLVELHRLADGRPLGDAVTDLVNGNAS